MKPSFLLLLLPFLACTMPDSSPPPENSTSPAAISVWIGSGDSDANIGFRRYAMDPESGALSLQQSYDSLANLSYFNFSPDGRYLYAVSRIGGKGSVVAFRREADNSLTALGVQDSEGSGPCFVTVDQTGKWVMVANYSGGTISVYPVLENGGLGPASQVIAHEGSSINPDRQEGPHPHMIGPSPNNRYVLVPDLGTDKVMVYAFDPAKGQLSSAQTPFLKVEAGLGPRHFEYHPNHAVVYVLDELTNHISVLQTDADQAPQSILQTISLLPEGYEDYNKAADVHLTPDGRFLYASNRGHSSIAMFEVLEDGQLDLIGHEPARGKTPRNFGIDPSGTFLLLANRESDQLVVFRINQKTGELAFLAEYEIPNGMCVKFL